MRNMSVLELLFALLLVCLMAAVAVGGFLVWSLIRRTQDLAIGQARDVAELKTRLAAGGQAQETQAAEIRNRLVQAQSAMEGLRSALSARQPIEEEARASLKRLESIIAGSSSRGAAGERILEEALRHLPPEMLQRNVWVAGNGPKDGMILKFSRDGKFLMKIGEPGVVGNDSDTKHEKPAPMRIEALF